jgi:hypothetical protein
MHRLKPHHFLIPLFVTLAMSSKSMAKEILLVGDSLTCGPFGARLVENLTQDPENSVTVFCTIASHPRHWIKGENPPGHSCNTCRIDGNTRRAGPGTMAMAMASAASCKFWINSLIPNAGLLSPCEGGQGQMPEFKDILREANYDQVIVALGTNSLPAVTADRHYGVMAQAIRRSGVADCRWIGPPHFDRSKTQDARAKDLSLDRFYSSLQSAVAASPSQNKNCLLIDSRPATHDPKIRETTTDGVHRKKQSARRWADSIMPRL